MKTSVITIILVMICSIFVASCDKKKRAMGEVNIHSTVKTRNEFRVLYHIPETDVNWHCVGANLRRDGDKVYLDFIEAHNSNDGAIANLPAQTTRFDDVHMVSFDYHDAPEFTLFIDGKEHATFGLGLPKLR